uniref:Neurotransmitter-gated ion-channel transmembrane domain-containing protein n=1 Tax=Ditylenchus dipsaci TaxID=166011 RepID=A0A915EW10_9BILA
MAKYLLLTFVLNVITILVTVIIINVYFRGPTTHTMPDWVRTIFLKLDNASPSVHETTKTNVAQAGQKHTIQNGMMTLPGIGDFSINPSHHHPLCPSADAPNCHSSSCELTHTDPAQRQLEAVATSNFYPLSQDAMRAIDAIEYITDHLKKDEEYKMHRDDWKYVAMVIDRFLLYIFFGITLGGTLGILLSAPYMFHSVDQKTELKRLIELYKSGGGGQI